MWYLSRTSCVGHKPGRAFLQQDKRHLSAQVFSDATSKSHKGSHPPTTPTRDSFQHRYKQFLHKAQEINNPALFKDLMEECNALKEHDKTIKLWTIWSESKKKQRPHFGQLKCASHAFFVSHNLPKLIELHKITREFNMIPTTRMYNNLIILHAREGNSDKALEYFIELKGLNLEPDTLTYETLIRMCAKVERYEKSIELFDEMNSRGLIPREVWTYNALIDVFGKLGLVVRAENLFQVLQQKKDIKPDAITYNTLLAMYGKHRIFNKTDEILAQMQRQGIEPDDKTLVALVHLYARQKNQKKAEQYFQELLTKGYPVRLGVYNSMLEMYSNLFLTKPAEMLFRMLSSNTGSKAVKPDLATYNIMIDLFGVKKRKFDKAIALFTEMQKQGIQPDLWTFNTLLAMYGEAGYDRYAEQIIDELREKKIQPDAVTYNILINLYCNKENIAKVHENLRKLDSAGFEPDNVTMTNLIRMYTKLGEFTQAEGIFRRFSKVSDVDNITLKTMAETYESMGKTKEAKDIYDYLEKQSVERDELTESEHTYTKIINTYGKIGNPKEAEEMIQKMTKRGLKNSEIVHAVTVVMCKKIEKEEQAKTVFKLMVEKMTPTIKTHNTIMEIFSGFGMLNQVEELFQNIAKLGLTPNSETYDILLHTKFCSKSSSE